MEVNKICICGGGSLGTVCAGVFLANGYTVNLLTGHPDKWEYNISVEDNNKKFSGRLNLITEDPKVALENTDLILLCLPGFLLEETISKIAPFVNLNQIIGSIVSNTGFFFFAHKLLPPQQPIWGFQRVPFIARYKEYGKSADLLGYKAVLKVASENIDKEEFKKILEVLFLTPVEFLNNFYEASLSNSNPILHTGRLFSMWHNYKREIYNNPILFYSDWTDKDSEIVLKLDEEFIKLRDKLKISNKQIPSLRSYYEVETVQEFTNKIKSISAFKNIIAPIKKIEIGYIPDFNSRYFTEDFPFGLHFIKELAKKNNISTPFIDKVYEWGVSKIQNSHLNLSKKIFND